MNRGNRKAVRLINKSKKPRKKKTVDKNDSVLDETLCFIAFGKNNNDDDGEHDDFDVEDWSTGAKEKEWKVKEEKNCLLHI